jgi:signal transduction histidine kinase
VSGGRHEQRWSRLRRLSGVLALLVVLLAVVVLLGWALGSEALTHLHPALPAMVPTTATCLLLNAIALLSLRAGGRGFVLAVLLALGTGGMGAATLTSYLWEGPWPASGPLAARMSPPTSLTLLLLDASLLCMGLRRDRTLAVAPWVALAALLPPLIALSGYAFAESRLYSSGAGVGIALHSAVGLTLLCVGALTLEPQRGPLGVMTSEAAGGVMARRMLPMTLLPLLGGALVVRVTVANLLDERLSGPLFAVTMMVILGAVILRNAQSLNRSHAEQEKAERQAREEAERQRILAADNARLYQAAQEAARQREDVLAIVSHDLKNPLSTIRLSTRLLSSRLEEIPEAAALSRQVAAINRAVAHMLTLVHQLLDAARLDAGQALAIQTRPVPLDPLLGEALAVIEPQASQKSLRLEPPPTTGLVVPCDRDRILQVLTNLLGNAVKFTPDGGELAVEGHRVDQEVRVSVRDSGPGIPESAQPHLFERHWQAEGTARQGSGLGLYIARGIIGAHGGRIWVDSTPGKGSTFTFSLPLTPAEPPHEA